MSNIDQDPVNCAGDPPNLFTATENLSDKIKKEAKQFADLADTMGKQDGYVDIAERDKYYDQFSSQISSETKAIINRLFQQSSCTKSGNRFLLISVKEPSE